MGVHYIEVQYDCLSPYLSPEVLTTRNDYKIRAIKLKLTGGVPTPPT